MQEDNRARAIRWLDECWNKHRPEVVEELFLPDAIGYMEGVTVEGPKGFLAVWKELTGAFPDISIRIEQTVSEGDTVVVRWVLSGTHQGVAFDLQPTGRHFEVRGSTWFFFRDAKVCGGYDTWNQGEVKALLAAA